MDESILNNTKQVLGLDGGYTPFDQDIIMHINGAFSILHQLGVGPDAGFTIDDATPVWSDFVLLTGSEVSLSLVRTYIFLKVRMLFDPPTTSFLLASMKEQIDQYEWRLNVAREYVLPEVTA